MSVTSQWLDPLPDELLFLEEPGTLEDLRCHLFPPGSGLAVVQILLLCVLQGLSAVN